MLKNTWGWVRNARTRWAERHNPLASVQQGSGPDAAHPAKVPGYSPKNVGNDASARPWERQHSGDTFDAAVQAGAPHAAASLFSSLPSGFDAAHFLRASEANFRGLQAAWDAADMNTLRSMLTQGMLQEVQAQLADREAHASPHAPSEVVMLSTSLLGVEEQDACYLASVEFSGLMREEGSAGPSPFREIWSISQPKSGADGWLVAGVQALQ